MESIYFPDLLENDLHIVITGDEAKHLKALHIKINEQILITNGNGLTANASVESIDHSSFKFNVNNYFHNLNEPNFPVALALGILNDRNRFEFALEKAIELGITDFYPLLTKYVQKDKINEKRLLAKSIASMKQCKRSVIAKLHQPIDIENLLKFTEFNTIILTNEDGEFPKNKQINKSVLVLVGPEGGFSENEIEFIKNDDRTLVWKLGNRRLRAETASISALSLI